MNKSTADPSGNYGDYLADTVEANKDSFSEDELNTLTDDIATIRKIEEQIAEMENGNTASEDSNAKNDLRSGIFRVRIMMATQLTKVCFPKMR